MSGGVGTGRVPGNDHVGGPMSVSSSDVCTPIDRKSDAEDTDPEAFLRVLCHELRTPVASLRSLSRVCAHGDVLSTGEHAEALRLIQQHAEHLSGLLDELRDYTQNLSDTAGSRRCDVYLPELVHGAAAACGLPADRLASRIDRNAVLVRVDPVAVRRILTNLLENSLQHGSDTAAVRVDATRDERHLLIVVTDQPTTGTKRTPAATRVLAGVGSGLGTGVIERLARLIGGTLTVERTADGGRRTQLLLPGTDVSG
jgi:two-component system, OmpR family, sensor kinase